MRRTAAINQIRGLLLERGITVRQGRRHIDAALPGILEDASARLSGALRVLLMQLKLELDHLQMRIDEADAMINKAAGENGLVWSEDLIFEYLPNPNAFLKKFLGDKGHPELATSPTKMTLFLADAQQHKDVIAYLKTFSKH